MPWGGGSGAEGRYYVKRRGNHMSECSKHEPVRIQYKADESAGGPSMSCKCRNMEKAGWLELWKGRLGCLGKWQWPMEGLVLKEGCFSSRIPRAKKTVRPRSSGWSDAPGFPVAGSSLMSRPLASVPVV